MFPSKIIIHMISRYAVVGNHLEIFTFLLSISEVCVNLCELISGARQEVSTVVVLVVTVTNKVATLLHLSAICP